MRQIILFLLLIVSLIISCSHNKGSKISTETLVTEDTFVKVLVDIHLADATMNTLDQPSVEPLYKSERHYKSIFLKYKISKTQFDSTFNYYARNLELFEKVYGKVLSQLSVQQGAISTKKDKIELPKIELSPVVINYYSTFDSLPKLDAKYKFIVSNDKNTTKIKANLSKVSVLLDSVNKQGPIISLVVKKEYKKIKIKTSFSVFIEKNKNPVLFIGLEDNKKEIVSKKLTFNNQIKRLKKWQNIFIEDIFIIPANMEGKLFKVYLLNDNKTKVYVDNYSVYATYE